MSILTFRKIVWDLSLIHIYEEAEKIVENITAIRREEHASFADFAVLYRAGFLSRIIEKKFTESGIPYEIFGGVKFYHRAEIQDIVAYLRLIVLDDDAAFKRIVNLPRRRFGRVKMQHLLSLQQDGSLYETLSSHLNDPVDVYKRQPIHSINGIFDILLRLIHHCYDMRYPLLSGMFFPYMGVGIVCRIGTHQAFTICIAV